MIQTKEELFEVLLQHKDEILNFGVLKIGLFGSFIKGKQNSESDIDFLIQFIPEKKSFRNFINLSFFLEEILDRKVELVTLESLSPYLKPYILQEVEYVLS